MEGGKWVGGRLRRTWNSLSRACALWTAATAAALAFSVTWVEEEGGERGESQCVKIAEDKHRQGCDPLLPTHGTLLILSNACSTQSPPTYPPTQISAMYVRGAPDQFPWPSQTPWPPPGLSPAPPIRCTFDKGEGDGERWVSCKEEREKKKE